MAVSGGNSAQRRPRLMSDRFGLRLLHQTSVSACIKTKALLIRQTSTNQLHVWERRERESELLHKKKNFSPTYICPSSRITHAKEMIKPTPTNARGCL